MATPAQVTVATSETTIYAGGVGRGLFISNTGSTSMTISLNGTAAVTLTNGIQVPAGATYEFPAAYYGTNQLPIVKGIADTSATTAGVQTI
jgi:hypothetical protein